MKELHFNTIQEFNDYHGVETLHPLLSVMRVTESEPFEAHTVHYGFYAIFLKENKGCKLSYGRTPYDFDEMTVTSFAPGQNVTIEPNPEVPNPSYTALAFHPDLLARTPLAQQMARYGFFDYTSNEALHLSPQEVEIFRGVIAMIQQELHHAIDKHTRHLVVSHIELLLNYCLRFYERQFITREEINHAVVRKFDTLLKDYIQRQARQEGLPTVAYFADKCCLSPGYFGELIKNETGRTAKDLINDQLLDTAKRWILDRRNPTMTEISNRLGFEYPQHFMRFFKRLTGMTPSAYKKAV